MKNYYEIADPIDREIAMLEDHLEHLHSLLEIASEHTAIAIQEGMTQAKMDLLHLTGY